MKKTILGLAATLMYVSTQAQSTPDTIPGEVANVTATKTLRKQSETGKVVTVINHQTLQNNLGKNISEVLQQQVGVFVVGSNNNLGSNQEVYIRGSGKILFLLNGVPVYDASTINNNFDINSINLYSVERIEILKGAQSTLYGSDAVAAVVNIITNNIASKEVEGIFGINYGSFNTLQTTVGIQGNVDAVQYYLNLQHTNTKGFSSAFDSSKIKNFEKDGMRQTCFSGGMNGWVTTKLKVGIQTQIGNYKADVDGGAFTDDKDYIINNTNFNNNIQTTYNLPKGKIVCNYTISNTNRKYINDSNDVSGFANYTNEKYVGNSNLIEIYTLQNLNKNIELIAGADCRWLNSNQEYYAISAFGPYSTKIKKDTTKQNFKSVFASFLYKTENGFNLEIGGRYNKHSTYGNNATFTFNPSININKLKIFANASSAFKTPSLYQLFGPGVANNKLKAEKSITYETGLQYANNFFNTRIVYFKRNITDAIDYNLKTDSYFNNNKQNDNGIEFEIASKIKKLQFNVNYCYLNGSVNTWKYKFNPIFYSYDIVGDTTYDNLFRRPKHKATIVANYIITKKWQAGLVSQVVGKRFEGQFMAQPITLKSYYTIDLQTNYQISQKTKFYATWRNITNQQYFDVLGYNTKLNNYTVGMQIIF